jgi:formate hydrogenlyase subunit 6/NADH:ubiquinone oxidoreductase subunit I
MANRIFIQTDVSKCTGCQNCQLICSITHAEIFMPATAKVRVSLNEPQIIFEPECDRCGLCARYCLYGALTAVREEE